MRANEDRSGGVSERIARRGFAGAERRRDRARFVGTIVVLIAAPVFAQDAPETGKFPPVLLSAEHAKLCRVGVGDVMPPIKLPQLGGKATALSSLQGQRATVVLFWKPDRWMSQAALSDLAVLLGGKNLPAGVAVVGIAVGQPADAVQAEVNKAGAAFPQLLDQQGEAFGLVGRAFSPRIYVLDARGRIVWFDIEYSEATRRELRQSLSVLAPGEPAS